MVKTTYQRRKPTKGNTNVLPTLELDPDTTQKEVSVTLCLLDKGLVLYIY